MNIGKKLVMGILLCTVAFAGNASASVNGSSEDGIRQEGGRMNLEQSWDKTFPKSDKVAHQKVDFRNRYGIRLVGDLYSA